MAYTNYNDLYNAVASGAYVPKNFSELLTDEDEMLSQYEFDHMSPEVQAWAKANPQQFMSAILEHRNPANNDLGSMGNAEGGYGDLSTAISVGPNGLQYDPNQYQEIHDESLWDQIAPFASLGLNLIPGFQGLGGMLGTALGATGAWAPAIGKGLIGAGVGGLLGGGKGAAIGGLGSGLSGYMGYEGGGVPSGGYDEAAMEALTNGGFQDSTTGLIYDAGGNVVSSSAGSLGALALSGGYSGGGASSGAGGSGGSGFNLPGILGAAAGALSGGSGSKQAGVTTTTRAPWAPMEPYLTGLASDAKTLYGQTKDTPQQMTDIANRATQYGMDAGQFAQQGMQAGKDAMGGGYDPLLQNVDPTDTIGGFQGMGELDPGFAYAKLLSGEVNNPFLNAQAGNITRNVTENLFENVLPGIRSGAQAVGGYGGSRQGIAEGLAIGKTNAGLSDTLSNLYGGAYENAQNRMQGAANTLGGYSVGQGQFNANLGMQQNQQGMQAANQALGNRATGLGMMQGSYNFGQGGLNDAFNMQNTINNYPWQQMGRYQSVVQPLAGMGGSESSPYYRNPLGEALGGAMSGYDFGSGLLGARR